MAITKKAHLHPLAACFSVLAGIYAILSTTVTPVMAAEDITTSFSSMYEINSDSTATITYNISLRNEKSSVFVSEYSVFVGTTNITNIRAFDDRSSLVHTINPQENGTVIMVNLEKNPVVGQGKSRSFTIQYRSTDIASSVGRILEVNVPSIANANEFSSYQTTIVVPKTFGEVTSLVPEPTSIVNTASHTVLRFDNQKPQSITAVFGDRQLFQIDLSYSIDNTNVNSAIVPITLIPDTAYQRVTYKTLSPPPLSVDRDEDGNWIASYRLSAGESLNISASLLAEVFMKPTVSALESDPQQYLGASQYWPTDDPELREIAQMLKTPKAIYDYVVTNLSYNYDRIAEEPRRLGAKQAIKEPGQAICTEFTDLFITLARAAGIPARELNGYAYTQNQKLRPLSLTRDILHAWPEYWDQQQQRWIQIDPTWGNTTGGIDYFNKLDFNHIVFAIHGLSPTSPLPAGFFKDGKDQVKTINVTPASDELVSIQQLRVSGAAVPKSIPTFRSTNLTVGVTNEGPQAIYRIPVNVQTDYIIPIAPPAIIDYLLPWQVREISFAVKPAHLWSNLEKKTVAITIGGETTTYETTTVPFITREQAIAFAISLGAVVLVVTTFHARSLYLSRRLPAADLRRQVKESQKPG